MGYPRGIEGPAQGTVARSHRPPRLERIRSSRRRRPGPLQRVTAAPVGHRALPATAAPAPRTDPRRRTPRTSSSASPTATAAHRTSGGTSSCESVCARPVAPLIALPAYSPTISSSPNCTFIPTRKAAAWGNPPARPARRPHRIQRPAVHPEVAGEENRAWSSTAAWVLRRAPQLHLCRRSAPVRLPRPRTAAARPRSPASRTTEVTRRYDAVVVGAGHNGLIAAAYLARAGRSVCVLERDAIPGGAVSTVERFPGYRVDRGSSAHIMIRHTPILDELDLYRHGLRYADCDPWAFALAETATTTSRSCSTATSHQPAPPSNAPAAASMPTPTRASSRNGARWAGRRWRRSGTSRHPPVSPPPSPRAVYAHPPRVSRCWTGASVRCRRCRRT